MNTSNHYLVPALNTSNHYLVPGLHYANDYLVPAVYNSNHYLVLAPNNSEDCLVPALKDSNGPLCSKLDLGDQVRVQTATPHVPQGWEGAGNSSIHTETDCNFLSRRVYEQTHNNPQP